MALPLLFLQRPLGEGIDPVDEGTSGRHRGGGGERRLDKRKATTGSEEASPLIRKKSDFRRRVSQTVTFSLSSCSTYDFWTQVTQLFFLLASDLRRKTDSISTKLRPEKKLTWGVVTSW